MFRKRSKFLFVANVLGSLYAIYLMVHFFGSVGSTEGAEQIGAGLVTAIIMPHLVLIILSALFGFLGFFLRKDGFNLTSGILYSVATALFLFLFYVHSTFDRFIFCGL
ncbi:MAG: hypothetical protein LRY71_08085 [Bacillaceae bacterium]|nr:hypothetical protein [Bacillaceae bacterium]